MALALARVVRNPNTSTVIFDATNPEQRFDNLKALKIMPKLMPEDLEEVDRIVKNKPSLLVSSDKIIFSH